MPIGEEFGGATYFMLETHYDNPTIEKDLVDTSGTHIKKIVSTPLFIIFIYVKAMFSKQEKTGSGYHT